MKNLIVFYSLEGNTQLIAQTIKGCISADILELKPKKEIPKNGFLMYLCGKRTDY